MFSNWTDPSSDNTFTKYFDNAPECAARSSIVSLKAAKKSYECTSFSFHKNTTFDAKALDKRNA